MNSVSATPGGVEDMATTAGGFEPLGSRCPEVRGNPNPGDPSFIRYALRDLRSCIVPMRTGNRDFGYLGQKRKSRRDLGTVGVAEDHHPMDPFARQQWQAALLTPGQAFPTPDPTYFYKAARYQTPGGEIRTMCVLVHLAPTRDAFNTTYNRRGIITAWWGRGAGYPTDCVRLGRKNNYRF